MTRYEPRTYPRGLSPGHRRDPWEADHQPSRRRRDTTGGAEGNERLTAMTGAVLLVLFAAEGLTILAVRQLLTIHFFLGVLLVGPVALKACATGYRFVRYYTGAEEYRRKGPPALLLRVLGPLVLATSLGVIGSGILLGYFAPGGGLLLTLHKVSFVLWFVVMTVHVLAYVWRLPRLIGAELPSRTVRALAGREARWLLLLASVLTGLVFALLSIHQAGIWLGSTGPGGH